MTFVIKDQDFGHPARSGQGIRRHCNLPGPKSWGGVTFIMAKGLFNGYINGGK